MNCVSHHLRHRKPTWKMANQLPDLVSQVPFVKNCSFGDGHVKTYIPGRLRSICCRLWASFRNVPEEGALLLKGKGGQGLGGDGEGLVREHRLQA